MKILVVDDEHSFGALLSHTLKRLGHKPVVSLDPADALQQLDGEVDAVITDIDMPGMNGVELARKIRELNDALPIAFCTGSAPEGAIIEDAATIGQVLPKVWTVADVKAVVEHLRVSRRRQPHRSSLSHLYAEIPSESSPDDPLEHDDTPQVAPRPAAHPPRARPPRVRVNFRRWSQVKRLCDDSRRGPVYATVPGKRELSPGQEVTISLALPDEITVKFAGEVQAVRPARHGRAPEVIIELAGLTDDMANRLRALAVTSEPNLDAPSGSFLQSSETSYLKVGRQRMASGTPAAFARGSDRDLKVSELLVSNRRLREQIEQLPRRLKGDEDE